MDTPWTCLRPPAAGAEPKLGVFPGAWLWHCPASPTPSVSGDIWPRSLSLSDTFSLLSKVVFLGQSFQKRGVCLPEVPKDPSCLSWAGCQEPHPQLGQVGARMQGPGSGGCPSACPGSASCAAGYTPTAHAATHGPPLPLRPESPPVFEFLDQTQVSEGRGAPSCLAFQVPGLVWRAGLGVLAPGSSTGAPDRVQSEFCRWHVTSGV